MYQLHVPSMAHPRLTSGDWERKGKPHHQVSCVGSAFHAACVPQQLGGTLEWSHQAVQTG